MSIYSEINKNDKVFLLYNGILKRVVIREKMNDLIIINRKDYKNNFLTFDSNGNCINDLNEILKILLIDNKTKEIFFKQIKDMRKCRLRDRLIVEISKKIKTMNLDRLLTLDHELINI